MLTYSSDALTRALEKGQKSRKKGNTWTYVADELAAAWIHEYTCGRSASTDIVGVFIDGFSYLFDAGAGERLIAAYGESNGPNPSARDGERLKGHPIEDRGRKTWVAGHAISHRLGGQADVNLVRQSALMNNRQFKSMEYRAVQTAGAFYFTHWHYDKTKDSQTPDGVDQGLIRPDGKIEISYFSNALGASTDGIKLKI
jgi:hypothetical protein